MRLILTCLITLFMLGGTYVYTRFAANVIESSQPYQISYLDETFSLEVLRTFIAMPANEDDRSETKPFPINEINKAAIRVLFKGETILIRNNEVPHSERLILEKIPQVELGLNEIFVCARIQPTGAGELAAMQVRVLSKGRIVAESTFTSHPGSPVVYGTITFEAQSTATANE